MSSISTIVLLYGGGLGPYSGPDNYPQDKGNPSGSPKKQEPPKEPGWAGRITCLIISLAIVALVTWLLTR